MVRSLTTAVRGRSTEQGRALSVGTGKVGTPLTVAVDGGAPRHPRYRGAGSTMIKGVGSDPGRVSRW